ncbi:hypothetical protein HZH68_013522 [Vespula germanica]|uniref:Uncharacterized protein n=1 Tax=Vespula germanica TaxID=30212 RepID=A0A834MVU8_VESGE|nr:hypothetical protein HZH68_013522 [Vespula germanica]
MDHMFVLKGDKSDNSWETFKYKISLKTTRIDLAEEIERGIRINRRERQTMVCPPTKTHRLNWDRFRTGVLLRYDLRSVQNPEHSIFYPSKSEDYFLFRLYSKFTYVSAERLTPDPYCNYSLLTCNKENGRFNAATASPPPSPPPPSSSPLTAATATPTATATAVRVGGGGGDGGGRERGGMTKEDAISA